MKKLLLSMVLILLAYYLANAQAWIWAKQFSSTGNVTPVDIVYGNDKNVYVAGTYTQPITIGSTSLPYSDVNGKEDIFLCSFSSNGTFRWARQIGGNNKEDLGGIAIDNYNNIYVVGGFQSSVLTFPPSTETLINTVINVYDAFLAKYDNGGNLIFADSIFWGNGVQKMNDVAVDFTNNRLVLAGVFQVQLRYFDGSVVQTVPVQGIKDNFIALYNFNSKYVSNIKTFRGSKQETAFKTVNNCVYGGNVQGYFVGGDLKGKLYLPGNDTLKGDEVNMDAMVIRYDANLNYIWSRRGGGTSFDHVNSAARDENGNIYIAGKCSLDPVRFDSTKTLLSAPIAGFGFFDYYLAKYNRNGFLQWIKRKGGPGLDNAYGLSVKNSRIITAGNIDNSGNINTGFDLYNINGNFIFGDVITGNGEDQGQGVAFNSTADSIYVTGYFKSTVLNAGPLSLTNTAPPNSDGFLVKYGYKFKIFLDTKNNIGCNGSNNGYIKVGTQFGIDPIAYTWTPNVSSTFEASNLAADTFKIKATDNSGQQDSIEVIITQPAAIAVTTNLLKNVTCYGGEDGQIQVTVTGGTTPRTLTWSGPDNLVQNNTTQTGLVAGSYKLVVVDANGCTAEKIFNVNQPAVLDYTGTTVTDITIPPECNGAVNLVVNGGTPPYSYSWSGPSGYSSTNGSINALCNGGNYKLEVTYSTLCSYDTTFYVKVDTGLNIVICEKTNISCVGEEDGSARVCVVQGGTGSYTYAWRTSGGTPVGLNDDELSGVGEGTYIVKVTDNGNLKFAETSVQIEEPAIPLTIVFGEVRDISCYGRNDGYINLAVSGGWGGYRYNWLPRGDTTQDVSNLSKGTWCVTVTDKGGCVTQLCTDIIEPTEVKVDSILETKPITCNSDEDGTLCAYVSGGTAPYTYLWNDNGSQNDACATDLYARLYKVKVTDSRGCKAQEASKDLFEPSELIINNSKSDVKCNGGNDGSITLSPTGGTPPYTYLWIDGPVTKDRINLPAGTYCVTVTDYHGCTGYKCIVVNEPATSVTIDSSKVIDDSCFGGSDGSITVWAHGGTGTLTYTISPGGISNITGIFDNLPAGDYVVEVHDVNSCSEMTGTLKVDQPNVIGLNLTVTNVSCNGWYDGSIIINNINGGTPPYSCSWDDGPTTCDRTDIGVGEYTLTVTDDHGCTEDSLIIVNEPTTIRIDRIITQISCNGADDGSIDLTVSGGTSPYSCVWDDGPTDCDRIGLAPGSYTLTVTDDHDCTQDSTFTIEEPSLLTINVDTIWDSNSDTGSITVTISGGTYPYIYKLTGGIDIVDTTTLPTDKSTIILSGLKGGDYWAYVIDNNICRDSISIIGLRINKNLINKGIYVYPNPTTGKLTVEIEARDHKDINLEILNMLGQVIWKKDLQYNGQPRFVEEIDLSRQSKGTYFMRVNGLPVDTKILIE